MRCYTTKRVYYAKTKLLRFQRCSFQAAEEKRIIKIIVWIVLFALLCLSLTGWISWNTQYRGFVCIYGKFKSANKKVHRSNNFLFRFHFFSYIHSAFSSRYLYFVILHKNVQRFSNIVQRFFQFGTIANSLIFLKFTLIFVTVPSYPYHLPTIFNFTSLCHVIYLLLNSCICLNRLSTIRSLIENSYYLH